jgi:hypothetical protein
MVPRFNIQKRAMIVITAFGGTGPIVYTILVMVYGVSLVNIEGHPVQIAIDQSWSLFLFFVVAADSGSCFQPTANRSFEVDTYNRIAKEDWNCK